MLIDSRSFDDKICACGNPTNEEAELIRRWSISDASLTLWRSCTSLVPALPSPGSGPNSSTSDMSPEDEGGGIPEGYEL